ncbi:MAG TPA: RNA methyltransferase, partial [Acidimicrobiales bacterium]|nr:RNA methyltransferase [Acidimicrobiales bacterium]
MRRLSYRHQRVQVLRRLVGRRSARQEEGCFVIEGVNLLEEALDALGDESQPRGEGEVGGRGQEIEIETVYLEGALAGGRTAPARLAGLLARCSDAGIRVFELEPGVLARVADTVTPQPVMAVVRAPVFELAALRERRPQLLVVCVDVRDPGNAGTAVRSAWAAGADGVVCCGSTVDVWNPKAVRASAGAVLHLPVVSARSPTAALEEMGRWGLHRLGTVAKGGEDYALADLRRPVALVFGNEAHGLPSGLGEQLDGLVCIPMHAGAGSINVGMAAAVLCFEAARQRRLRSLAG